MIRFLFLFVLAFGAFGQTVLDLGQQGADVNFSNMPFTYPMTVGATLPAVCGVGQMFFLTSVPAGQNLYGCTALNTWTAENTGTTTTTGSTGGSGTPASTTNVLYANSLNSAAVPAGQAITVTADKPTTWKLTGSGSIVSQSGNSVTYQAPASVASLDNIAGCEVLPLDSVFKARIDSLPVHASSAAWITQSEGVAYVGISIGQAWGVNIVDNSTPLTTMNFYYSSGLNGAQYPLLSGNNRTREGGAITTDGGHDHHMITVNHQTCHVYETYHDYLTGYEVAPQYTANSGYDYLSGSYSMPKYGSTDAAGLPLYPLTVHMSELQAGVINHALRFTSCAGCISNTFLWPATGTTGGATGAAPMGTRWRLKSTFDLSKFSPKAQVILKALQQYGMVLADIGGINQIQFDQDCNYDPDMGAVQGEIQGANINQNSFDIVDESSLQVSPNSSQALGSGNTILTGSDGNGNTITVPVAVQPVLIGTPDPVFYPQAGTTYTIPSWVNGATSQAVTWSLVSGPGSVSASGTYTAPASVTAPTAFTLKGVAAADQKNPLFVSGYVIPSGAIRLDVGGPSAYTDTQGNVWMGDTIGLKSASYDNDNETYPSNKFGSLPDQYLYGWWKYTWGDDMQYGPFIVPNGTYTVTYMFAEANCTGTYSETNTFDGGLVSGGLLGLDVNGVNTPFNFGAAVQDACLTPATKAVTVNVTNHILRVNLRATGADNAHQAPFLNAFQVIPAQ